MKILHINEHLAPLGGVETYLIALLPELAARGYVQQVIYSSGDPQWWPDSFEIPVLRRAGFSHHLEIAEKLTALLQREKPDIIHIHNFQSVAVVQAAMAYGPTVMTAHDHRAICPSNTFFFKRTREECCRKGAGLACFLHSATKQSVSLRPKYGTYFYYRSRWMMANAGKLAHIITPSTRVKERFVDAGLPSNKITPLPYFCSLEPLDRPRSLPTHPTITFIGRVAGYKGFEFFVEALGLLPKTYYGILVGNMTKKNQEIIGELSHRFGCTSRLEFRPWADRAGIMQLLGETSVLIFPSVCPETLGIVGLEALSQGVPAVASDIGGVREWLIEGDTGRLVAPKSATEIRDAVLDICQSPDNLLAMGTKGIAKVRERFLPHQHVNNLINIYNQAI